ncbi:MAG: hypothetical protein ABI760_12160 [Ferruginibacter sp.]
MKRQLFNLLIYVLFLFPVHLFAQHPSLADTDITGLWKGSLYNDTTEKYLPYEIAINEEKGKLSGYSYTLFDIDGKKEWGVKRIKLRIKDDQVIIEDVELISNDYSAPPPRKVRVLSVVNLLMKDSAMLLTGKWSTNQTREYRPLTGSLQLERAINYRLLILFEKLVELKLDKDLSFLKTKKTPEPDIAIGEKAPTEIIPKEAVPSQSADVDKPGEIVAIPPEKKTPEPPIEKSAPELLTRISAPEFEKKTSTAIALNESLKKRNKPSAQAVKNKLANIEIRLAEPPSAAELLTRIPAPEFEKKTGELIVVNVLVKKGNKPSAQEVKNKLADIEIKPPEPPSAAELLTRIPAPDFEKKAGELTAVNASLKKGNKAPAQSIVKAPAVDKFKELIRPRIIIAPVTEKKKEVVIAANDSKKENNQPVVARSATIPPPQAAKKTEPVATLKEPVKKENQPAAEIVKKPARDERPAIISAPVVINKTAPVVVAREPVKTESSPLKVVVTAPVEKKDIPVESAAPIVTKAAANVSERKMSNEQSVYFDSDSLTLTLYDNGEVDGDTVSVLMNGKVIFARQGLTTKANSKTVYVEKEMTDSLSLVMYAENLGSIPPNTGLLIIMDGEKRYEVRFTADLKTNAAILLRRRIK